MSHCTETQPLTPWKGRRPGRPCHLTTWALPTVTISPGGQPGTLLGVEGGHKKEWKLRTEPGPALTFQAGTGPQSPSRQPQRKLLYILQEPFSESPWHSAPGTASSERARSVRWPVPGLEDKRAWGAPCAKTPGNTRPWDTRVSCLQAHVLTPTSPEPPDLPCSGPQGTDARCLGPPRGAKNTLPLPLPRTAHVCAHARTHTRGAHRAPVGDTGRRGLVPHGARGPVGSAPRISGQALPRLTQVVAVELTVAGPPLPSPTGPSLAAPADPHCPRWWIFGLPGHQAPKQTGISTDPQVRGSEACAQSPAEDRGRPRLEPPPRAGRD